MYFTFFSIILMHFSVSMYHIMIRASKGIKCIFFGIFYGFFLGVPPNLVINEHSGKPLMKKN